MAIWDKRDDENSKSFAAFVMYRRMVPSRRSVRAVQNELLGAKGKEPIADEKQPSGTLRTWCMRFQWVDRSEAYDKEQDRIRQLADAEAIREMSARHINIAMLLQSRSLERLQEVDPQTGRPAIQLNGKEVLAYLVEAAKLERLSRGQPTERVAGTHELISKAVESMTNEELAAVVAAGTESPAKPNG